MFEGAASIHMSGMLSVTGIADLLDAAMTLGLDRQALLAGIEPAVLATLQTCSTPAAQLLCDLHTLNSGEFSTSAHPLVTWLTNAQALCGPRHERAIVARQLAFLGATDTRVLAHDPDHASSLRSSLQANSPAPAFRISRAPHDESSEELAGVTTTTIVTSVFRVVRDVTSRTCLLFPNTSPSDVTRYDIPAEVTEVYIGRSRGNHLIINEPGVSRRHTTITAQSDGYWLRDLDSSTGTYLNNIRLKRPVALFSGDRFRVRQQPFVFLSENSTANLRRRLFDEVMTLQASDPITGLPSWRTLLTSLENFARSRHPTTSVAPIHLAILRIDDEAVMRESWGNGILDDISGVIARLLRFRLRDFAVVGRDVDGGFVVWSSVASLVTVRSLLLEVMKDVSSPLAPLDLPVTVTLSVGVATGPGASLSLDRLVSCARACVERASARGNHLHVDIA